MPKVKGLGLRVIAYDPYVSSEVATDLDVEMVDFPRLLKDSDFISVHATLTEETKKMFGWKELKEMKTSAFLINTARGGIVDTEALSSAVSEGSIAGAGLDVVDPDYVALRTDHPFFMMDNVIITGHSAFYSESSRPEMSRRAPQEVIRSLSGDLPYFLVNPEVKYNFDKRWKGGEN